MHYVLLKLTQVSQTVMCAPHRVMTVSFHRYGSFFFPGTGNAKEIGFGHGKWHTLNIPFDAGLTDGQFWSVFQPVMQKVMDVYQPGAVVLQCGGSAGLLSLPTQLFVCVMR